MLQLESIIKKNRPNIGESSVRTYMCSIKRIVKDTKIDMETTDDFVKNVDEIIKAAKEYTPMVRKSRLTSVVILLDDKDELNDKGEYQDADKNDALKKLRYVILTDSKTVDNEESKQELSEKQKKNFLPQNEIINIYNVLKEQTIPLFKLHTLNKKQFEMMQLYVLLSLYVLIPPRRSMDYSFFKIRNVNPEVDNFFIAGKKKKDLGSFIFNQYKNSKKLGAQIIERIPRDLEKIIDKWKQYNKSDYLLINNVGNQVSGSKIALWLNQIFGKNISVSMLRHIYLSNKFGDVNLNDLKDTAKDMGNSEGSLERILKYVQKGNEV